MIVLLLFLAWQPEALVRFEEARLAMRTDRPVRQGADPFAIRDLPGSDRLLVLARGSDRVLVVNRDLTIHRSLPAPREPLAWDGDRERLFIAGRLSNRIGIYAIRNGTLSEPRFLEISSLVSPRDLVLEPTDDNLILTDAFRRRLFHVNTVTFAPNSRQIGAGANQMALNERFLVINEMWERRLRVTEPRTGEAIVQFANDGPFWSLALTERDGVDWLLVGGIEDHPLERTGGGFGYVDSFLTLYRLEGEPGRVDAVNLSEHDLVMPKNIVQTADGDFSVAAFGSGAIGRFSLQTEPEAKLVFRERIEAIAGISDLVSLEDGAIAMVSPLLDRIAIRERDGRLKLSERLGPDSRDDDARLGELLFFTTLLAPANETEGGLSRFTCEACHFEGEIDGRVHFTGRDDVHATPKTLRGLADTVPLFSSGGDDTLAKMIEAEFAVANQGAAEFTLKTGEHPLLRHTEFRDPGPTELREALLAFFIDFEHAPNPWLLREKKLSKEAIAGLEVFRERCEDCHQAVETTREPAPIPFEDWQNWLEDPERDPIWASPFYYKTGLTPYFDEAGTQVPSLRRIWERYPYFGNGSASSLEEVLRGFRYQGTDVWHSNGPPNASALTGTEIAVLTALLEYF